MGVWKFCAVVSALAILLTGCGGGSDQPAMAVQSYLQALVDRNTDQLSVVSCKDWEAQALTEMESFSAVEVTLQDAACKSSGEDGGMVLVTCSGKIVANYGAEVLEIDLSERTYQAVSEAGDWRMCGYR